MSVDRYQRKKIAAGLLQSSFFSWGVNFNFFGIKFNLPFIRRAFAVRPIQPLDFSRSESCGIFPGKVDIILVMKSGMLKTILCVL